MYNRDRKPLTHMSQNDPLLAFHLTNLQFQALQENSEYAEYLF